MLILLIFPGTTPAKTGVGKFDNTFIKSPLVTIIQKGIKRNSKYDIFIKFATKLLTKYFLLAYNIIMIISKRCDIYEFRDFIRFDYYQKFILQLQCIQKMQKPKEIIVQTGQLSLNMREKTMYVSEGKTYLLRHKQSCYFYQRVVLMNGVVHIPDIFRLLNLKVNLYAVTFSVFP